MRLIWLIPVIGAVVLAQAVVGLTPNVDYLWLGARWVQLPKFPGDTGIVSLSFYVAYQYVDVSVGLSPACPYITPLDSSALPSAGPGVVTVNIAMLATALNVTCPVNVYINARYRASGSSLVDGIEKLEYVNLYIPPYPTASISTRGTAYLGLPSNLSLIVTSPYKLTGLLSLQGSGARVISPAGPVVVNGSRVEIPLVVIPDSPTAALQATIQARDWLGNPVTLTYAVPISAMQPPPPVIYISPTTLYANKVNKVNITIVLPVPADGAAVVTAAGAVLPQSSITIPIKSGRGSSAIETYPMSQSVVFNAQVGYQLMGVSATAQVSAMASVQQSVLAGVAKVDVRPSRLIAGVANNVTISVYAPGPFNASISVSNAAVDKPLPYYFGGSSSSSTSLVITPLSTQPVTITVTVMHSAGTDQYTINLPVSSSSIFTVIPTPSLVLAGGNRTITLTVVNGGDVAVRKAVITVSPATSTIVASTYTFELENLGPLESANFPISFIVPATYSGAIAFAYNIIYTTQLGATGSTQGVFYLQALQTPAINITGISVVPQIPQAGRTFYITITVVNRGFSSVTNLQVEARVPRGIRPVTSPIYFAGQLDPQQTASIPLSFNTTAPGQYQINLTLSYTDQYGNVHTMPYSVNIVVSNGSRFFQGPRQQAANTPQQGQINATYIGSAIAAVVAIGAALFVYRKRKKR